MVSGGLSSAVHWWEEAHLRVLVLGSMALQQLLFAAASLRKLAIPAWFRFFIWLSYLGSDALAIYALATFFNRHGGEQQLADGSSRRSVLEVLWAPVLLMHLGGQASIAA
ncbi:hypothetical protein BAE44_0012676 [Dichanthelium oligosanthes]|uniref:DUF4220 domain-containing protein n=1 Tax=Dichanthelium oligosanthes TaxID=888268 RepID=A0A1E5VML0_9POAL|nr:hypothetical protein BAE44_0012676 [Dichanthelium oligosanthes]